jgi:hypothetical protein
MLHKILSNFTIGIMCVPSFTAVFLIGVLIVVGLGGLAIYVYAEMGNSDIANEATNIAKIIESTGVSIDQTNVQNIKKIDESTATNRVFNSIDISDADGALVSQNNIQKIKGVNDGSGDDEGARNAASNYVDIHSDSDNIKVVQENERDPKCSRWL